jgi:hypothetical protein
MAHLRRELYRQVKGPEITHADCCTLGREPINLQSRRNAKVSYASAADYCCIAAQRRYVPIGAYAPQQITSLFDHLVSPSERRPAAL